MELLPAIDLRAGTAVRLTQGDFDREDRYGDPVALAARYIAAGARWIHVVDLDGARTGVPHERAVAGGGSCGWPSEAGSTWSSAAASAPRTMPPRCSESGVSRVVLGTAALEEPGAGRTLRPPLAGAGRRRARLPGRRGRRGRGAGAGVAGRIGPGRSPICSSCGQHDPIGAVVATSVARDGMLSGPDLAGLRGAAGATSLPVVASGGVSSLGDLVALAGLQAGGRRLSGAIVGKAIVEGRFSVEEGIAACAASD